MDKNLVFRRELLTGVLGQWPTFHDSEVHRLVLDRMGADGPTLEACIHVRYGEMSEVAVDTLVTFLFTGVVLTSMDGFSRQNVLDDVEITAVDPALHDGCGIDVWFSSLLGVSAAFKCKRCEVIAAEPYVPSP